jgi:hypothetical protein
MDITTKYDIDDTVMYKAVRFEVIEIMVYEHGISYGCRRDDGSFLVFREAELWGVGDD